MTTTDESTGNTGDPAFELRVRREVERRMGEIVIGWPQSCSLSSDRERVLLSVPIEGKPGTRHVTIAGGLGPAADLAAEMGARAIVAAAGSVVATEALKAMLWILEAWKESAPEDLAAPDLEMAAILRRPVEVMAREVVALATERWVSLQPVDGLHAFVAKLTLAATDRDDLKVAISGAADALLGRLLAPAAGPA